MTGNSDFGEYSELLALTTSSEWCHYVNILSEHKEYLQKQVNAYIRQQKWIEAYGALSKRDDIDKVMEILVKRMEDLKKEMKTNG